MMLAAGSLAGQAAVLGMCLLLSALFSGSETALFNLSRADLEQLAAGRSRFGHIVARLLRRPGRVLNTLLLGNMLVNIAFSAAAAVLVLELEQAGFPRTVVAGASVAPLLAIILFGEVTPKMFAYRLARPWALAVGVVIDTLQRIFYPVLLLLEHVLVGPITKILAPRPAGRPDVTPAELTALMGLSARRGLIDLRARDLLQEIVELTDLRVCDVMVPRVDLIAYDVDGGAEGLIDLFRRTKLRRVPVYRGDLDHVLGVVHARRVLLNPAASLESLVRPASFLPETANLEKALRHFQKQRRQLAVVVDEYGGTAGLVTLEDVMEEVVGDIHDPGEPAEPEPVQKVGRYEYLLAGDLAIHDWAEAFQIELERGRISTLGGFVTSLLGRIPRPGDSVTYRNLVFSVRSMRGRRVGTIHLHLRNQPIDAEGGQP